MQTSEHLSAHCDIPVLYRHIDNPTEFMLEYRIIAFKKECNPVGTDEILFSILIAMEDNFGGVETEFLYDVTRRYDIALSLQRLLYEGAVTPCTAKYIISDLL